MQFGLQDRDPNLKLFSVKRKFISLNYPFLIFLMIATTFANTEPIAQSSGSLLLVFFHCPIVLPPFLRCNCAKFDFIRCLPLSYRKLQIVGLCVTKKKILLTTNSKYFFFFFLYANAQRRGKKKYWCLMLSSPFNSCTRH